MHVGKKKADYKCKSLLLDKWAEEVNQENDNNEVEIKDTFEGDEIMKETEEEKYSGVLISNDGRNLKNIKARVARYWYSKKNTNNTRYYSFW